jgi:CheY-like chemotaxis protein
MNSQTNILLFWGEDEDYAKMLSVYLQKSGYSTTSVKSFHECVKFYESNPPSLLIMRSFIDEPRDGLEFIQRIRQESGISYFPIIVGWADFSYEKREQGYQEFFAAGANACFGSVYDITDVFEEIEVLLKDPRATHLMDRQTRELQKRSRD